MKDLQFRFTEKRVITITFLYALLLFGLGSAGLIAQLPGIAFGIIVTLVFILLCTFYVKNHHFRKYMRSFSIESLTFIHLWRIIAAVLFIQYGVQQQLPQMFAVLAGYGDLIAGLMVPFVLYFRHKRSAFWIFNIIGFADFIVAVGTGLTFTFLGTSEMENIRLLPLALIPLFGVPISGLTHIVMFDKLRGKA